MSDRPAKDRFESDLFNTITEGTSAEGFISNEAAIASLREYIRNLQEVKATKADAFSAEDLERMSDWEEELNEKLEDKLRLQRLIVEMGGEELQIAVQRRRDEDAAEQSAKDALEAKKAALEEYKKSLEELKDQRDQAAYEGNLEVYEQATAGVEALKQEIETLSREIEGKPKERAKTGSEVFASTSMGESVNKFTKNIDSVFGTNLGSRLNMTMDRLGQKLGTSFEGIATQISGAISALDKHLDDAIKDASKFLTDNYTLINSNLKGFGLTFDEINEKSSNTIGLNRFVKQTDYLTQVAKLTQSGIAFNVEERAMLATLGEKLLNTFDAQDSTITRLTRYMGKDVTSAQYGVEYTLRNTLNKVFGDHSFLNNLYDNVISTIQDAALAVEGRDITPFNSSVSTWLGYMYEYGLSDEVVSKIAQGINYLGSGNVTALANSPDLQRLMLLSMDTAGLNYAEILQQGLDVDTTNVLMKSIISYLDEIVNNTKDNLVLQNSYANLFNMSITDMKAIHNLANTDIDYLSSSNSAIAATYKSIADITDDTYVATQIDNMMANAAYTYGASIAGDDGKYIAYKVSDVIVDVMEPWTQIKGAVGRVASAAQLIGSIGKFAVTALGLTSVAKNLFGDALKDADTSIASNYINTNSLIMQRYNASTLNSSSNSSNTLNAAKSVSYGTTKNDFLNSVAEGEKALIGKEGESDWTKDDHDTLDILKEFERTIMMSDAKQGYAIAVSLEGMNNDVLKSFASIFADEDAMLKTYEGKNSVIKDSLFNYVDGSEFGITSDKLLDNAQKNLGNEGQ